MQIWAAIATYIYGIKSMVKEVAFLNSLPALQDKVSFAIILQPAIFLYKKALYELP